MNGPDLHVRHDIPFERSLDLHTARSSIESTLSQLGLTIELEESGQIFKTFKCMLKDASGNVLDYGFGKGPPRSAEVGAIFEAVEHWFGQCKNANAHVLEYRNSFEYSLSASIPNALLLDLIRSSPPETMALRKYKSLSNDNYEFLPVGLSSPKYIDERYEGENEARRDKFDYARIESYSSNSGIAIGSNELDAITHGLLEVVERDSLSDFLVNAFLFRKPESIRVVEFASLPGDIRLLIKEAEEETGCEVIILELKNKFHIPCYCAALKGSDFEIEIVGYGCSLSREHAARRSVYELVQCFHITTIFHPVEFEGKNRRILNRFSGFGFHLRCAKMKIHEWSERIGYVSVKFHDTEEVIYPSDGFEYLQAIVSLIEANGHKVFSSVLSILPGGETVVHSVFERQENLFIATEGGFVLPDESRWANNSLQRTAFGSR